MPPEPHAWVAAEVSATTTPDYPLRAKAGDESLLIFKTATGLRGVERHCPHERALLTKATLMGNGSMLRCPMHNFVFRFSDGIAINCPGYRLGVFEVKDEHGVLWVRRVQEAQSIPATQS